MGVQIIGVINFSKKQIANFFSECLTTGFEDNTGKIALATTKIPVPNGAKLK